MGPTSEPSPLLDAALSYAARGWHVLPLKPRAKVPLTKHGVKDATTDEKQIREWWGRWPRANIGIACGPSGLAVVDVDVRNGGDMSFESLFPAEPDTVNVFTGSGDGSRHWYFAANGESCRVLAPGLDLKGDGGYVVVPPSMHPSGEPYRWEASGGPDDVPLAPLPSALRGERQKPAAAPIPDVITTGERNTVLTSLAGSMRRRGASQTAIRAALHEENASRCAPPLPDAEVDAIAANVARYAPATPDTGLVGDNAGRMRAATTLAERPWPELDRNAALVGLAGDFVKLYEPHVEADPAAMLVQFLVGVGNLIGRSAYWTTGADDHYTNLFALVVGKSAIARKGTSWGVTRQVLRAVDPDLKMPGGLSTGEGLIWAVHDEIRGREYDRKAKDYENVVKEPAIEDKRLLVVESEFIRVLRVMTRKDNTLREVLNQAWERGDLEVLTRQTPIKATGAHVSIIGHATLDTLRRFLDDDVIASGLGNRFLFVCARRSKSLPFGGSPQKENVAPLVRKLRDAVTKATALKHVDFDEEATGLWASEYDNLTKDRPGLFGALTSRLAPIARRLATIYLVLDQWQPDAPQAITVEHLRAALAVTQYAQASVAYLFGDSLGDPTADQLLRALRQRTDGRMNRNEVHNLFSGHGGRERINRAITSLVEQNLVRLEREQTGGRPVNWLVLVQ